jgi:hypothetical protein
MPHGEFGSIILVKEIEDPPALHACRAHDQITRIAATGTVTVLFRMYA